MKKSIVYLGIAVMAFTNVTVASNAVTTPEAAKIAKPSANGTPLCLAISKGDVNVVRKLIEYGASVNESSNGMTPLMYAARYNNVEILQLLLEKGANLKAKDDKGYTALKHAEISGANEAAAYLKTLVKK